MTASRNNPSDDHEHEQEIPMSENPEQQNSDQENDSIVLALRAVFEDPASTPTERRTAMATAAPLHLMTVFNRYPAPERVDPLAVAAIAETLTDAALLLTMFAADYQMTADEIRAKGTTR